MNGQENSGTCKKIDGQKSSDTFVKMDGQEIFRFAVKEVPKCINELMEKMNITSDDVDMFVLHQANLRICQGIAKRLKISMDKGANKCFRIWQYIICLHTNIAG